MMNTEITSSGGVIGTAEASPVDNCCSKCYEDPDCTGFVVFAGWCYLKGGHLVASDLAGRTGYMLPSPPHNSKTRV